MPKLAELGLGNEKVGDVDFADMPEQRGGFTPPPQPGTYRYKLPTFDQGSPIWDKIDTADGPRLNVVFEGPMALTIVQSPGGTHNGESFDWRVDSNQTRAQVDSVVAGTTDANTYQGFKNFVAAARWKGWA